MDRVGIDADPEQKALLLRVNRRTNNVVYTSYPGTNTCLVVGAVFLLSHVL
eukprot:COSAG02_NODE_48247_length_335_cov_0.720339_1_plen_51_part_00